MRRRMATVAGRVSNFISRLFGRGGGTAIGGLVATRICPDFVVHAFSQLESLVLVTGTNGKTTTTALIVAALEAAGHPVISNPTGSNLERGLAATVIRHSGWDGRFRVARNTIGVFELDEWAFASLASRLQPGVIVLLNLFRDQLDRYGEVERTAFVWRQVVIDVPLATIVANADDPSIVSVAQEHSGQTMYFGVDADPIRAQPEGWADARRCRVCETPFFYNAVTYAHLGDYQCPRGHLQRPSPSILVTNVKSEGLGGIGFTIEGDGESVTTHSDLPGLYNAYNVAGAVTTAAASGLGWRRAVKAVVECRPIFGRAEVIATGRCEIVLLLVKNPAGANQILDMLASEQHPLDTLLLLNDGVADGQDVSWIWDVEFERLNPRRLTVGGRRAEDLGLRLKYAGVFTDEDKLCVVSGIEAPLDAALATTEGRLAVLATYTAMLEVRDICARRGWAAPFWLEAT